MPLINATGTIVETAIKAPSATVEKLGHTMEGIKEISDKLSELNSPRDYLYSKIEEIKSLTPEQIEVNPEVDENVAYNTDTDNEKVNEAREGLTDEEKIKLKEETGWPDEIINNIGSLKEAEIYKNAGLVVARIGDKPCLIRPDIDWNQKDQFGRTNLERARQGLAPLDSNGQSIELHHIGQHNDSPLAELTLQEHRGTGNDTILHDKTKESEIDRNAFGDERSTHWKERAGIEGVNANEYNR